MRLWTMLAMVTALQPSAVWSQSLLPGARVRVTERHTGERLRHTGTLIALDSDSIAIALSVGGSELYFGRGDLLRLERSGGRRRHLAAGLALGLVGGFILGGVAAQALSPYDGDDDSGFGFELIGSALGTIVGTVAGGVVGHRHQTDKWIDVPATGWHMSVRGRSSTGFALGIARAF